MSENPVNIIISQLFGTQHYINDYNIMVTNSNEKIIDDINVTKYSNKLLSRSLTSQVTVTFNENIPKSLSRAAVDMM